MVNCMRMLLAAGTVMDAKVMLREYSTLEVRVSVLLSETVLTLMVIAHHPQRSTSSISAKTKLIINRLYHPCHFQKHRHTNSKYYWRLSENRLPPRLVRSCKERIRRLGGSSVGQVGSARL